MLEEQLAQTMQTSARPFLPLLGTLFLFLVTANLSGLLPGVTSPTAYFETDAALALIVLVACKLAASQRRAVRAITLPALRDRAC